MLGHVLLSLLAARHEALHAAELKLYTHDSPKKLSDTYDLSAGSTFAFNYFNF